MELAYGSSGYSRYYTEEEAKKLFLPVVERIFVADDNPAAVFQIPSIGSELFLNRDWRVIGIDAIAWDGLRPFVPPNAPETCVQLDRFSGYWDPLRPLWMALAENEIDEIIHMAPFFPLDGRGRAHKGAISTFPISEEFGSVVSEPGPLFADWGGCIFSRDGRWAVYSSVDDGCIVGGENAFITRVIDLAGGEVFLREVFNLYWHDRMNRMNLQFQNYAMNLYACIGWEPPEFLKSWVP